MNDHAASNRDDEQDRGQDEKHVASLIGVVRVLTPPEVRSDAARYRGERPLADMACAEASPIAGDEVLQGPSVRVRAADPGAAELEDAEEACDW